MLTASPPASPRPYSAQQPPINNSLSAAKVCRKKCDAAHRCAFLQKVARLVRQASVRIVLKPAQLGHAAQQLDERGGHKRLERGAAAAAQEAGSEWR